MPTSSPTKSREVLVPHKEFSLSEVLEEQNIEIPKQQIILNSDDYDGHIDEIDELPSRLIKDDSWNSVMDGFNKYFNQDETKSFAMSKKTWLK